MMIRAVDPLQHTSMYQRAEEGFFSFRSTRANNTFGQMLNEI